MHARTTELIEHLEKSRSDLRAAVDAVPAELRDKQPSPDKWSTAQVLEHLAHTESSVTGLLERGMRKLERAGLKPATDASAVLPTIDAKKLLDRATKFTAPETVRPTKNLNSEQAWQVLKAEVAAEIDKGRNVVVTGDLNRPRSANSCNPAWDPPSLHPRASDVGGSNIDYVFAVPAMGYQFAVAKRADGSPKKGSIALGIDGHDAHWVVGSFRSK